MSKLTVVVPARNELYLQQTITDLFAKAAGDIEVILVLDNYWPDPIIADRPGLTIIHWGGRRGMRAAINAGAEIGKGDFILKCDAHVLFDEGYDVKLAADCDGDWLVTPLRYGLDAEKWERRTDKPAVDYEYLSYPYEGDNLVGLHARYWWNARHKARKAFDVDENMAFQGSCWMMPMKYFRELIYPMDIPNYGLFVAEPQEIGLKVWLGGGKCMINKKASYCHLWKGQQYRDLHLQRMGFHYTRVGSDDFKKGNDYSVYYWFNDRWPERIHDLAWLVDRFWPVPTWPDDRNLWTHSPGS